MTPAAAVREALGPAYRMKSDREIAHIMVSVLESMKPVSSGVLRYVVAHDTLLHGATLEDARDLYSPTLDLLIDALIEEVTAE